MKRNDPYTRIHRQPLWTLCILIIPFVIGIIFGTAQSHASSGNHVLLTVVIILIGAGVALLVALVLIVFLVRSQLIFTIVVDEHRVNAEYRRKVLALLSIIAARTGLPLYDLSPPPGASKEVRQ